MIYCIFPAIKRMSKDIRILFYQGIVREKRLTKLIHAVIFISDRGIIYGTGVKRTASTADITMQAISDVTIVCESTSLALFSFPAPNSLRLFKQSIRKP